MKKYRNLIFYVLTIGGFSLLIYFILVSGKVMEIGNMGQKVKAVNASDLDLFKETIKENFNHPLAILLLQIITIIITARVFGYFCQKIGQPTVIGEILAGVFLGPSLIGTIFPGFSAFLFPAASLGNLQFLSQIGLILFMFVVGMELDLSVLKKKANDAILISHASIIIPFSLGLFLAYFIYTDFAPKGINFLSFALFIGIAMSITAFPVLARIVQERQLAKTKLGAIVITCAAADDITAWCILAAVIAVVKAGTMVSALYTIVFAVLYVVFMLIVIRPFLRRLGDIYSNDESLVKPVVAVFFIILIVSAYATEVIGIHALFGAFMAGVIMPPNLNFRKVFIEKVEDVSMVLLLPLFFVFTGLRTQIGLLNDPFLWKICGLIILVSVAGKFLGSALAAKFVKNNWRDSLIIGALMNTRGLMELIVLNIGYDLGVLKPEVFTMMVIMALFTTFMTSPTLSIINWLLPEKKPEDDLLNKPEDSNFKILISYGHPERGKSMLRLANAFIDKNRDDETVYTMHLTPSAELNKYNIELLEQLNVLPIQKEADRLNLSVDTMFIPSTDIRKEISTFSNEGNYDLTLVGMGQSIFEGSLLGKVLGITTRIINPEKLYQTIAGREHEAFDDLTNTLIRNTNSALGILIDKGLMEINHVFIPIFNTEELYLLRYARRLINNQNIKITFLDALNDDVKAEIDIRQTIKKLSDLFSNQIDLFENNIIDKDFLDQTSLMIIGLESWERLVKTQSTWLINSPSVLIIKNQVTQF